MDTKYQKFISRICLGTVEFGVDYGVKNVLGKPDKNEINAILKFANKEGIISIDTAYSYGDSENIIGEFIKKNNANFKIISKLPTINTSKGIERFVYKSLSRLNTDYIYGYLIHEFGSFLKNASIWDTLENFKKRGIIKKVGFSIYTPRELEIIFKEKIDFDIIQIPYSIFDRRFENFFPIIKKKRIEIYVRSVFLQGLAFLKPNNLKGNLIKAKNYIKKLHLLSAEKSIPISAICLDFALLNPFIDKIIIGINRLEHFEDDISGLKFIKKVRNIYNDLMELNINNEDIVLPYKWNKL